MLCLFRLLNAIYIYVILKRNVIVQIGFSYLSSKSNVLQAVEKGSITLFVI